MSVFWDAGFAATSLDDITAGTGMNRPSLYTAFGDKQTLYRHTLDRYRALAQAGLQETLRPDRPLRDGLRALYEMALSLYFSGERGARGCYWIGTALTEAVLDAGVREQLAAGLHDIDAAFEARFRLAKRQAELSEAANPRTLALMASAFLHTLAIRSRAGEQRAHLHALINPAIDLLCGAQGTARPGAAPRPRSPTNRRARRTKPA